MRSWLIAGVIVLSWRAAREIRADDAATVAIAPSVGGLTAIEETFLAALDVSLRTRAPDWWLRGEAAAGETTAIDEGEGHVYELRVGLEHRERACRPGCFYYGVDLGLVHGELHDGLDDWQLSAALAIPRAGIDAGGDHVRFRIGVEVPIGLGRVRDREPDLVTPIDATTVNLVNGFAVTTAVVFVVD
jgi:hypothetical protein